MKCENVLLTKDLKPLLTDFGFSKHLSDMGELSKTYCGSSAYAPLEILKGEFVNPLTVKNVKTKLSEFEWIDHIITNGSYGWIIGLT